ncbi:MAG: PAS domain-containing protein [Rhodocyclales bacterium]|nr:PAS domain-containing protein [Rhodocyclales bacterium]
MIDELSRLLAVNGYLPHGYCISWSPTLLWTFVASDILIFLSYFSMPVAIGYFAQRRKDFPYRWLLWLFAVFIMACGATHLMGAIVLWQPMYGLDALLKAITAFVSVLTAVALWPLIPHALKLPSPDQLRYANEALQTEIAVRKRAEEALRVANKAVEASLQKERMIMAAIVEGSSDSIYAKDLEGRYLMVNREFERLIGKSADQIIGSDDTTLLPPDQAKIIRDNDCRVIAESRINTYEQTLSTADGERTYLATKSPLQDGAGQVIGMFGISRDITERYRAAAELRQQAEALAQRNDELERFNRATVGRELEMISLKQQVNGLSRELGRAPPFALDFAGAPDAKGPT